ncbi:MAG: hypothetical protein KGH55_02820 [Nanoarchaeota archaeon]|nr:hypothetical protein [Nanoarchaeota archaeon]
MVHDALGLQHAELKKKFNPNKKDEEKRILNKLIYVVGFLGIALSLPQIINVWTEDAVGVSVISWIAYSVGAIFWMIYGIIHKARVIIISYLLWTLVDLSVVAGVLIHR